MDGGDDERAAAALTTRSTALLPSSAELTTRFSLYGIGPPHPLDISSAGVAACRCERCEQWAAFVATGSCGQPMYLVPTSDLVERFARWLLCERDAGASRVLELGAGDGALSRRLSEALAYADPPMTIVASDSGARGLAPAAGAEVLPLDAQAALHHVAPHIVFCAFMPLGDDWTAAMRALPSVRSYVLLGEVDDGCCGRPWATWGYLCDGDDDAADVCVSSTSGSSSDDGSEDGMDGIGGGAASHRAHHPEGHREGDCTATAAASGNRGAIVPSGSPREHARVGEAWRRVYEYESHRTPFGRDGWSRAELAEVSATLVCRTDTCWSATRHARAVVFRRS